MKIIDEFHARIEELRQQGKRWEQVAKDLGEDCAADALRMKHARYKKKFGSKLDKHIEERGINKNNIRAVWDKNGDYSVYTKYDNNITPESMLAAFRESIEEQYGKIKPRKLSENKSGDLLVIDPADLHIGKLSTFEDNKYNIALALQCANEGIHGIMDKAKGFNVKQVLFVIGNDVLHVDNPRRTTTSGTPQDTDGMWFDAFSSAISLYTKTICWVVESGFPVHVVHCPSNHDYVMGSCLAQCILAYFREDQRVTFDIDMEHRKYFKWGSSLLGFSHGDGAKQNDYPMLMANESKMWDNTVYRYWLLHHLHHYKKVNWVSGEDYIGATVRYLRSPSQPDRWHKDNGYVGAKRAIEGFVYSYENGQIGELTHNF